MEEDRIGRRNGSRRRREILDVAVRLFAQHGYYGVSMDDIGAAANITGPALYHHFKDGKEQMLAEALVPVSERMLDGGKRCVSTADRDPRQTLEALVDYHVSFAVESPEIIIVHLQELDRLPESTRREVRKLQREYVEQWVNVLVDLHIGMKPEEARVLAHGAFGLMNSTPYQAVGEQVSARDIVTLLKEATLSALLHGYGSNTD
ncbi:TetR/AcrR family transcriptional regulator [Haloglycomyces albus]|uniref:TetR/AcrR family transcriptional regulator n=1 Tax=Haloglycomyces albus TaxID=526067 RepID=UPI00046D8C75|nr:TetR/AcrR family transcriptional regulator [Haloglycomyces albus]